MRNSTHKILYTSLLVFAVGIASLAGVAGLSGCHQAPEPAAIPDNSGPDPADANMAPVDGGQQQTAPAAQPRAVLGQSAQNESQQRAEEYAQTGAQAGAPVQQGQPGVDQNDQTYNDQVAAGEEAVEQADAPPPPLPVYEQPEAPAPNYLWTPGYWSFAPAGYYWVPGAWCAPPYYGALWTPGYWGFYGGRYLFYRGFWGTHIGFYGGINYGFGYTGSGYHGGYWNGHNFYYNRAVNRVNVTNITHVYNRTVVVNNNNRVAYNGGRGGLQVRPQPAELAAMRGPRVPPMNTQLQNQREAAQNREQFYNQNKGRPAIVAAPRPIVADKSVPRPEARPMPARPGQPETRPGQPETRPGQPNQPGRPQIQPTRPGQPETRPGQPETRPVQPAVRPGQPQTRPVQPETRPGQPETRPAQPQTRPTQQQVRPQQPTPRPEQPQTRPAQPQPRPTPQPQTRPAPQPQPRPQPIDRPAPQPQPRPAPQPQSRPAPQPQPKPAPQPKSRPAPQPQSRPAPQPHQEAPHQKDAHAR